jgi:ferredoxin
MKYAIFYFSPCGGTKTVADIISRELGDAPMQELTTPSMNTVIDHDTLTFFCVPVYGGRIPKPMYDRMSIIKGDNTPCVPVAVFGNRAVDDALLEMSDLAAKSGFVTVAGCEMVAPHSIDTQFGAGRPDESDKAKLHAFLEKLKSAECFKPVQMPGDPEYAKKKVASLPLYPVASKECSGCGICEKYCPAGAIKGKHMRTVPTKCINCMRCVNMCSTESRKVPAAMRLAAHLTLKKLCSDRKEPNFYL